MICPNCSTGVSVEFSESETWRDGPGTKTGHELAYGHCPECRHIIVLLRHGQYSQSDGLGTVWPVQSEQLIYPAAQPRPLPPEVPDPFRADYREAWLVLPHSTKASAAIARRVLQHVLRDIFGIKKRNLEEEIDEFIGRTDVPTYLADAVDAVRQVGNLASHPIKNTNTGEVTPVEPGEAEWLLETLESLFDFAFVQPRRLAVKRQALDSKLKELGKPSLKGRNRGGS